MVDNRLAKPTRSIGKRPFRFIIRNWRERHRHPFNFWIHLLVGIPLMAVGYIWLLFWPWGDWVIALPCFVVGCLLQYWGHCVEGNDMGELAGIKRLLGLPYVAVAPRWQQAAADSDQEKNAPGAEPS